MKLPELGFNKLQSFIEFFTTFGKSKFGLEGLRLFSETGTEKKYFDGSKVNQIFDGSVDLSNAMTHYASQSLTENTEISVKYDPEPIIGGYAELTLVGDGSHSPTFESGLVATPGSATYDSINGTVNKIGIYYGGDAIYYTVTVIPL